MARQRGIFKFTGKVGDQIGYRGANGEMLSRKASSNRGEKFKKRESSKPFLNQGSFTGLGSNMAKRIKLAFNPMHHNFKKGNLQGKMTAACVALLKSKYTAECPLVFDMSVLSGKLSGFSFREDQSVKTYAWDLDTSEPDHETGWIDLRIGGWSFGAAQLKRSGATHLRWMTCVAALPADESLTSRNQTQVSGWMDIRNSQLWECAIHWAPFQTDGGGVIIAIALESAICTNGHYYPTQTIRAMDILRIIA